jgi:hypothetical protein
MKSRKLTKAQKEKLLRLHPRYANIFEEYDLAPSNGPSDDGRKEAIERGRGYDYAYNVDKGPRDDNRDAAIAEGYGLNYLKTVDIPYLKKNGQI